VTRIGDPFLSTPTISNITAMIEKGDLPDSVPKSLNRVVEFLVFEFLVTDFEDSLFEAPFPTHELPRS